MELNVRNYVESEKQKLKEEITKMTVKPKLTIIKNNADPRSNAYVKNKIKDCKEVGIEVEVIDHMKNTYENPTICQLPYDGLSDKDAIKKANIPDKFDVDGFSTTSEFNPCTPQGVIDYLKWLNRLHSNTNVVIFGRGELVGKPLAKMFLDDKSLCGSLSVFSSKSSVTEVCDTVANADVIVTCMGKPINEKVLKEINSNWNDTVTIIDCGIQFVNGKLQGDILQCYYDKLVFCDYTPVPKGVGLLTRLALLKNVVKSYK